MSSTSRFGIFAFILMFVPIIFLLIITIILEPAINSLSNSIQRLLMFITLLLPALVGFIFAITGLVRKESRKWLHIISLIFNLLQSLYFGFLISFAG